jgi:hypothetical protein
MDLTSITMAQRILHGLVGIVLSVSPAREPGHLADGDLASVQVGYCLKG